MQVGSFGPVVFEVTDKKVFTPDSRSRTNTSNWATHDRIEGKSRSQYLSPGLTQVQYKVRIRADMGILESTLRFFAKSQAALALAQTGFFRGLGKFVNGRNKTAPAIVDNQNVIVELAHRTVTSRNATCEFFLGSGGGEAVSVLFALEFLFHGINLRVGRTPFVFDVCVIPHKRRKCNAQLVQRILRLYGKIASCKITANAVNLYKRSDNK